MTPFEGCPAYLAAEDRVGLEVDCWIRTNRRCDGVVDFDRGMRDPHDPDRLKPEYESGDHIHSNDPGYAAMARAIDLKQLL
jgi:lysophospholipase L1-like esterase